MGEFLRIIIEWVTNYLIIWRVVWLGEMGCRWTKRGQNVANLKPGFYWFCPIIQKIETTPSCYQEVDTILQTFTTPDGKGVTLSANVGYTIYNAAKFFTEVHDFDDTIERAIRGHNFEMLYALDYADIRAALPTLTQDLRERIHEQSTKWGVRIHQVRLTDFVSAPTYRVLNEAPKFILSAAP